MVDYKQILRLRAEGVSQRGIADVLGCSRNTVAAVFAAATTAGVGFGEVAELGADEVRKLLLGAPWRLSPAPQCTQRAGLALQGGEGPAVGADGVQRLDLVQEVLQDQR